MANTYVDAVTKTVDVNGTSIVYRETGQKNDIPVVLLHHRSARVWLSKPAPEWRDVP